MASASEISRIGRQVTGLLHELRDLMAEAAEVADAAWDNRGALLHGPEFVRRVRSEVASRATAAADAELDSLVTEEKDTFQAAAAK